ncbi:MAG: tyrosine--tRNA ligase [Deltaproteobacteria bacterium]|nr:tyrosine--tRNA ligase [Deltaproteobacteria bacterium]
MSVANILDIFYERGFVEQVTDESALRELFDKESVTCYIGFDPTASSLHVGSLIPIMSLVHMQRQGHRPIALVGGGTGLVGDPSGKTEMRKILTYDDIAQNAEALKVQLSRYLDFGDDRASMLNNADWLTKLNYIEFLRDIGRHFSVNRMLTAESCKLRLETGLSFIEFNYMLLQAYDFLYLREHHDCRLQLGGSDQWGNIVAGIDLIRRMNQGQAYGITFPLITTSSGAKMGKTAAGAVWLDAGRTTPYDYYQYWINTEDPDVEKFLGLFTFLPMDQVRELGALKDADIRRAKEVLAYEATKITHGENEADEARRAARALFGGEDELDSLAQNDESVPYTVLPRSRLAEGIPAFVLFTEVGLCSSRGEARRLITQGGGYVNNMKLAAFDSKVMDTDLRSGAIMLRMGKKKYHRVRVID